jgi:epoxyqueuosine reductase QueG
LATPISDVKAIVQRAAERAGFDVSGIAPAAGVRELEHFPTWIAAGHAGEMKYLEARDESGELKRASLSRVAPWARSVIVSTTTPIIPIQLKSTLQIEDGSRVTPGAAKITMTRSCGD